MQRWGYGTNNLYKSCHVSLEEGPWWAFVLPDVVVWLCERCPRWNIPFVGHVRITRDDEQTTVGEWYGDTFHDWFHLFVCMPVFDFGYKHIETIPVELSWDECKRLFYSSDPARWDADEADPEFGCYEGKTVEEVMAMMSRGEEVSE